MGKDREGRFHPRKGRPSAAEGVGNVKSINSDAIDEHLELEDKYTDGDEPAANVHVRHRNRNVDKREGRQRNRDTLRFNNPSNKSVAETYTVERTDTTAEELTWRMTREQFGELANHQHDCCITLYLATNDDASVEANRQKDFITFKNKLQQVTAVLRERGFDETAIETLLKPGYDLLRTESFWGELSKGLAVFISEGYFRYIRLPDNPGEEILVNTSFYLAPLIPIMTRREYFYVLVLSKKRAKLYRGDAFGMEHVQVTGMPRGINDVVHFEQKDDQDLFRTSTIGAGGGASFHGIGTGRPDHKTDLAAYFSEVDETLWTELLHEENVPLLLVGVEYLIPIYKQVAKYKPIREESITGNRDFEEPSSLYPEVRKVMEPYFREREEKALENYGNQSATGLTSSIPDDVISAAHYGRVSQLFARQGAHIWGTFDEMNNKLTTHDSPEEKDECLVDRAIIKTIMNGGEVFILDGDRMPGGSALAALMRY